MNTLTRKPYTTPTILTLRRKVISDLFRILCGAKGPRNRKILERQEDYLLSKYAWKSINSLGRLTKVPEDHRNIYMRDYDRILHTRAIEALAGKTQVFTFPESPHIHNRRFHTDKVVSVAVDIGRALGLNEDLIAAIALGHDLGHPPFGHDGERVLSEISMKYLGMEFKHNLHSLRIVDVLENKNLTAEVRNGIVCHCGESLDLKIHPGKIPKDINNLNDNDFPYTLEGCVVRLSDQIAYLAHDYRDSLFHKLVSSEDLPKVVKERMKTTIPEKMLGVMVEDVIEASFGKNYITMSFKMLEAREALFHFLYDKVIKSKTIIESRKQIPEIIKCLFVYYHQKRKMEPQKAIDQIASLTDRQAFETYQAILKLHGLLTVKL